MSVVTLPVEKKEHPHFAAFMLLLGTAAWSLSFSFNKDAGHRFNELAGLADGSGFGPNAFQGVRFTLAALIWVAAIPAARRGWTWLGVRRAALTGFLLACGVILMHLALEIISPAETAFLSSLTVLWVPILSAVVLRKIPNPKLVLSVGLAVAGLMLLSGEGIRHLRTGEMLALACSVAFSLHLLAVSKLAKEEGPWRLVLGQFLTCGLTCLLVATIMGPSSIHVIRQAAVDSKVLVPLGFVLVFPTFIAFSFMNLFQPRVSPTRAVIIYQLEGLMATGFDFLRTGRGLDHWQLVGAGLLIAANLLAELLPGRGDTHSDSSTDRVTGGKQDDSSHA